MCEGWFDVVATLNRFSSDPSRACREIYMKYLSSKTDIVVLVKCPIAFHDHTKFRLTTSNIKEKNDIQRVAPFCLHVT